MKKRGISQIVSTILIILLVLAAIVIVWQVIENIVERGGRSVKEKTLCFETSLEFVEGSVKCDATVDTINGTVSRGADSAGYIKMKVVAANNATDSINAPASLGTQFFEDVLVVPAPSSGESIVVKVAPVVGENFETVCDPSDTVTVTCS